MSVDQYQRSVNSLDKDIAELEKKKASADKKAADEESKANGVNWSRNASESAPVKALPARTKQTEPVRRRISPAACWISCPKPRTR